MPNKLGALEQAIADAEEAVGLDPPISRFKVEHQRRRAHIAGIERRDREAILRGAARLALESLRRFSDNLLAYRTYGYVGVDLAEVVGDVSVLDDAIRRARDAWSEILDLEFEGMLTALEAERRKFAG